MWESSITQRRSEPWLPRMGFTPLLGQAPQYKAQQGCQAPGPMNGVPGSQKTSGEGEMRIKIERNVDCIVTASIKLFRHFSLMSQQQ